MHHVDAQLQLSNLGSWLTRTDRQKDYSFWLIFTHIGWYGRNIRIADISAWILAQIQLSSLANIIYNCNKYNLRTNSTGSEIAVRQRARNCTIKFTARCSSAPLSAHSAPLSAHLSAHLSALSHCSISQLHLLISLLCSNIWSIYPLLFIWKIDFPNKI